MKKRYTDQQIAFALKQEECGISVDEIIRKMGIGQATFYNWKDPCTIKFLNFLHP